MQPSVSEQSYRDPAGFVFFKDGKPFRQVNKLYSRQFDTLHESGLYDELTAKGLLVPHTTIEPAPEAGLDAYKILQPEQIEFISYPYEWCFDALKDAALATLDIQLMALHCGMTLKDAPAYNIQFQRGRPVLIDSLSFEIYAEGQPWFAYNEFCRHFVAPLALMATRDARLGRMSESFGTGIPLDVASKLLPWKTKFNTALLPHIHMQAKLTADGPSDRQQSSGVRKEGLVLLLQSLRRFLAGLELRGGSMWSRYYQECTYVEPDLQEKEKLVASYLDAVPELRVLWDLGANTGRFSRIASSRGVQTYALDYDPLAVNRCYLDAKAAGDTHIWPLVQDLTNPTPSTGWMNQERKGLLERASGDAVMALALVHHICIGANVPFRLFARMIRGIAPYAIVEFVPPDDPQSKRLMSHREKTFEGYHREAFLAGFSDEGLSVERSDSVGNSGRELFLFRGR